MSVMLYPYNCCVVLLIEVFVLYVACLTVFVNCLMKQFAICLGVILLLNVIEVLSGWRCSVAYTVYGLTKRVCAVHVIHVASKYYLHRFYICMFVGRNIPFRHLRGGAHVCFFVFVCILCDRVRVCSCCASYHLVYCVCLPLE